MVEITSEEQNKVKKKKKKKPEDSLRDLWDNHQTCQHSNYRGPRRREKERV